MINLTYKFEISITREILVEEKSHSHAFGAYEQKRKCQVMYKEFSISTLQT